MATVEQSNNAILTNDHVDALATETAACLDSGTLRIVGVTIVVLDRTQIGLGYSSRDSESAATLHATGNYSL